MDHLAPIWLALPAEIKGHFYARGRAEQRAKEFGIEMGPGEPRRLEWVMTASYEDCRAMGQSKIVLLNHGSAQTYRGEAGSADHPSYTGGKGRENVVLNICPSERDAEACRATGALAVAAGPVKMDDWYNGVKKRQRNDRPIVAISFHADVFVVPETRSAFGHYRQGLIDIAKNPDRPFDLLGHGHPRWGEYMAKFWKRLGVPFARHFDEVLEKADMYACDNSSTMYEMASTDRPVLALNPPWYRKNVEHGLRFWSAVPGLQLDEPADLRWAIEQTLLDGPGFQRLRREAVQAAYGNLCDGKATRRAVDAIVELVNAS